MDGLAFDDLDAFGRELNDPFEELVQDVVHILLEQFGSNPDVQNRGVGLVGELSGPANRIPRIKAKIESELQDDERIAAVSCTITETDTSGTYQIDLVLTVSNAVLELSFLVNSAGGVQRVP